jgi:hypothetical protein
MKELVFTVREMDSRRPGGSKKHPKGFGYEEVYYQVFFTSPGRLEGTLCQEFSLRCHLGRKPSDDSIRGAVKEKMKFMYDVMASDKRLESSVTINLPPVTVSEFENAVDEMTISDGEFK